METSRRPSNLTRAYKGWVPPTLAATTVVKCRWGWLFRAPYQLWVVWSVVSCLLGAFPLPVCRRGSPCHRNTLKSLRAGSRKRVGTPHTDFFLTAFCIFAFNGSEARHAPLHYFQKRELNSCSVLSPLTCLITVGRAKKVDEG